LNGYNGRRTGRYKVIINHNEDQYEQMNLAFIQGMEKRERDLMTGLIS
jgi:hypothetical protein